MALEGVLLNVYSGDDTAVSTMLKLVEGSNDKTQSVNGDELQTTCTLTVPQVFETTSSPY